MNKILAAFLLLAAPAWPQFAGFSKKELIQYTPLNPYERFEDGRPKAPDALLQKLRNASSEEVWAALWRDNYHVQFESGWQQTHTEKVLVGRVFTAQYMPARPEIWNAVEPDIRSYGKVSRSNQRVIDMLQPGDVLVVDVFGKVEDGAFVGDNLTRAIYIATGNGFIVNGGIRDRQGLDRIDAPIYCRGYSPTVYQDVMLTGINVPVRIGNVTVMPGDIAFGDREGVSFIPPHMLPKVIAVAEAAELKDAWTREKMETHKYKSLDVYPAPNTPELKKDYEEWLKKHQAPGSVK